MIAIIPDAKAKNPRFSADEFGTQVHFRIPSVREKVLLMLRDMY
jgi:hypothetical protein